MHVAVRSVSSVPSVSIDCGAVATRMTLSYACYCARPSACRTWFVRRMLCLIILISYPVVPVDTPAIGTMRFVFCGTRPPLAQRFVSPHMHGLAMERAVSIVCVLAQDRPEENCLSASFVSVRAGDRTEEGRLSVSSVSVCPRDYTEEGRLQRPFRLFRLYRL